MPLPEKMQLEQEAANRSYAENSYIEEPSARDAVVASRCDPDPDEPHEAEDPNQAELDRRAE